MKDLLLKSLLVLMVPLSATVSIFLAGRWSHHSPEPSFSSSGPTVTQVQSLAELVTVRIMICDVLTGEDEANRGSWLVKGDARIGIDLSRSVICQKDPQARTAVIKLPKPHVVSARVDHNKTTTWDVRRYSWIPWHRGDQDKLRDVSMQKAQDLIEFAAKGSEFMDQAKEHAEQVIKGFYELVGWHVSIEWIDTRLI
jgi:hypothetical protein